NHAGSASVDAYHRWSSGQPPYRATSREHTGNGNYYFIGIEAENNGTGEPWSDAQIDLYVRGCAALCNHFGWDPFTTVWQHGEWTSTKIDTAFINPRIGWDEFRDSVWMAMVDDKPNPTPQETNRMIAVVIRPDNNKPHAMYADGMLDKISSVNVFTGMPTIGLASPLSTHDWNSMVGVNKKCRTARGHNPDYITKID
ncbi:MAG: N-acetylmuramoyl-L-alanine amidase, partial [bacterium]|nr:N-acetylmuramoyl-L-alanine amidase [bacterium]